MNSNLKWIIYTVLGISILLILFVAYGCIRILYFKSVMEVNHNVMYVIV